MIVSIIKIVALVIGMGVCVAYWKEAVSKEWFAKIFISAVIVFGVGSWIGDSEKGYMVEIVTEDKTYTVKGEDFGSNHGLFTEATEYHFKEDGKSISIPVARVKEIIKTPLENYVSHFDEGFSINRATITEDMKLFEFDKDNPFLSGVFEQGEYTYFIAKDGKSFVPYENRNGIDTLVKWTKSTELDGFYGVKRHADKWVVRSGDKHVVVTKKAAQ